MANLIGKAVSGHWADAKKFGKALGLQPREARSAMAKMKLEDPEKVKKILQGNNQAIKVKPERSNEKEKQINDASDAMIVEIAPTQNVQRAVNFIIKCGSVKEARIAFEAATAILKRVSK
jgi:hypothetical protein